MEYQVTGRVKEIDFGATGLEAIDQNIRTIITTLKNSVPLDRSFGIDPPVDEPYPVAESKLTNRIIRALRQYETRIEVVKITYQRDIESGQIIPTVRYRLASGVIL
ncbi:GPW/gp25 family protein [Paenibacillus sp. TAB 01]|uniref:GPW/gp25 family protein n=1 Tax=Paenibacillus sp. TAB 01 TaxID=3368988 RepID=UPI003752D846